MHFVSVSLVVLFLWIAPPSQASESAPDDFSWERFRLPENYQGHAVIQYELDGAMRYWNEVDFSFGKKYVYLKRFKDIPGVGVSIIDVRNGDFDESLRVVPSENVIYRTRTFEQSYSESGESELSPLPIVRALFFQIDQIEIAKSEQMDDGVLTYQFSGKDGVGYGVSEIDVQEDRIIAYRSGKVKSGFVSTIHYGKWMDLPSGAHVPTVIRSDIFDPQSETITRQVIELTDIVELASNYVHTIRPLPQGFTVIDHIEGVSKVDGKVIDKIQYGQPLKSNSPQPGARGKQASKFFIWIGAGFVIVAGIVLGTKLKAAS